MTHFETYAELQKQIKDLQEKSAQLQPAILQDIINSGEKNKSFDFGTFSVSKRKSYVYSDEFKALQSELKTAKKYEEDNQEPTITESLMFRLK